MASPTDGERALALTDPEGERSLVPGNGATRPKVDADPGLYAVLGLDPSASDAEIQTTYRRQAARLVGNGGSNAAMRQLNVAYEVLGNPVRRADYDRVRTMATAAPPVHEPPRPNVKSPGNLTRRRRPRHAVQPRYAGGGDVLVVLVVVAFAVAAAVLIIPRLSINLSSLNALQSVIPGASSRRAVDAAATPAASATRAPTPTVKPGFAERFAGSTVSVANPTPAPNAPQTIVIRLRRDGQPANNLEVWATVDYRTTQERWPAVGSVRTDPNGAATITFNVGPATPGYEAQVHVFAQVDDQQLSWATAFTPR